MKPPSLTSALLITLLACGGGTDAPADSATDGSTSADAGPDATTDAAAEVSCAIEGGGWHLCIRRPGGSMVCAGGNGESQLGDATTDERHSFVASQPSMFASNIEEVSAGEAHTCVQITSGEVYCWGSNWYGELSVPVGGGSSYRTTPIEVTALGTDTASLYASSNFTCALKTGGAAYCWGANGDGQLGIGGTSTTVTPTQLSTLGSSVAQMSAGYDHACAVKTDGTLWCWGFVDNSFTAGASTPYQVTAFGTDAVEVAAGTRYVCVRKTDHTAWCWGYIGPAYLDDLGVDSATQLLADVAEMSAGDHHVCARKTDGTVWCFGAGIDGQLGDGMSRSGTNLLPAIQVSEVGSDVVQLTSMRSTTCARKASGSVWCWGFNGVGMFGNGTTGVNVPPTEVTASCGL
jgi:alpha-tubulin suppressor-like RCC1 family protein